MATNILTTGSTAADSGDITLDADTLVALKDAEAGAKVVIKAKDDASAYQVIEALTQEKPSGVLPAGVYQFSRLAGAACGVFRA